MDGPEEGASWNISYGAGKSSLMGAMLLQRGVEYFNPDHAAQRILSANPGISQLEANSAAWHEGKPCSNVPSPKNSILPSRPRSGERPLPSFSTKRSRNELKSGFGTWVWTAWSAT